jgi:hypothetical protein
MFVAVPRDGVICARRKRDSRMRQRMRANRRTRDRSSLPLPRSGAGWRGARGGPAGRCCPAPQALRVPSTLGAEPSQRGAHVVAAPDAIVERADREVARQSVGTRDHGDGADPAHARHLCRRPSAALRALDLRPVGAEAPSRSNPLPPTTSGTNTTRSAAGKRERNDARETTGSRSSPPRPSRSGAPRECAFRSNVTACFAPS